MLASDRQSKIMEIITRDGSVKTSELVEIFEVSLETIRRDFDALEKQGLLEKVYGGAILKGKENKNMAYSFRKDKNISEKRELAKLAVDLINDGDTIALNASSTNLEIAKLMKDRFSHLTVITNSLMIANELAEIAGINMILAGGIYNKNEYAFLGEVTARFFQNFSVDKIFLCVGGISLKIGLTDYLMDEVLVEKKMLGIAEKVYVLADSSKIESNSLIKIDDLTKDMIIITDSNLDKELKNKYSKKGIEIIN